MSKKLLLILCVGAINFSVHADDTATNFMLMNNYNVRQSSDIWERMRSGFRLDSTETQRVKYYERLYTKNPTTFNRFMKNASPYLYFVLTETERYGLPSELALIPIVESDYDSFAVNGTGRYDGIWQFVPSTGADFGLYENSNVNERRNIVKATNAAMIYFNYLDILFRQWDVAIGSYNWGPGNMYKAVISSNQKIGYVNYSDLPLRSITANYVPKLVALANIIRNPGKFGIKLLDIPNQPYFAITHPANNITVAEISNISHTDYQTFKILNPHLKNNTYTLNQQSQVLLPLQNQYMYLTSTNGTKNTILARSTSPANITTTAVNITKATTSDNSNIVPVSYDSSNNTNAAIASNDAINQIGYASEISGSDSTSNIKPAVNVTYREVEQDNVPVSTQKITQTDNDNQSILIIPKQAGEPTPTATTASDTANKNEKAINALVDDLEQQRSKPTIRKQIQNVKEYRVTQTRFTKTASVRHIKYRVGRGDTLYSISRKFDVDIAEIKKINKIHGNSVKTGQLLTIRTSKTSNSNA